MKNTQKSLAIVLCLAMLLSFVPIMGVHAAETVIWADDFESYAVDAALDVATDTAEKWSEATVAETSTVSVFEDSGKNHVARLLSTAEKASGPRFGKKLYLKGVKDLTVEFRVRTEGGATVTFNLADGNKVTTANIAGASSAWTKYKVVVDVVAGTYVIYKDGQVLEEGVSAAQLTAGITVRFGGSVRNFGSVYYDDIKITTTTEIDLARLSNPKNADPLAPPSDIEGYQAAMAVKRVSSSSDMVVFEDNFDSFASNDLIPASPDTVGAWSARSASATATVTAMQLDGTKVLRISNSASTASGPRLIKNIYPAGMDKFTISFMVRTEGTAQVSFTVTNGIDTAFGLGGEHKKWTAYEYVCDIKKKTYICYKNGEKDSEGPLGGELDSEISFRFSGSTRNSTAVYYDNIKITTPNKVDLERVQTGSAGPELTVAQYVDKAAKGYAGEMPPASSMPADAFKLFSFEDNNGISTINTGTDATWTSVETKDTIKAAAVKGNEVLLAVNPRVSKRRSALTKKLGLGSDASDLTIETNLFFIGAGATSLSMGTADQATVFATQEIGAGQAGVVSGWNTIRYDIDFKKEKYSIYLNGKAIANGIAFTNKADNYAEVTVKVMLINADADAIVLLDNVSMYTKTPVRYTTMLYGSEGVNWDMVKGTPITAESFVSNLRAHPRVLVNDWDVMREKIATNKQCANWYQNLKDEADFLLTAPNIPYTFENGRNWLTGGRNVRYRLETLGFVYGITGERKYIDRALEEMRFAATHPDWSNTAPIISSECMLGYAMAYDWMYYGLTDEEKAEIRQIICDKALWQFVHSYAGRINVEIASGVSNRTMVSNGCGLMTAVAIADEMPEVANYIYKNAIKYAKPPFEEFSDDGGFPEGAMYWDYASRFAVLLMSTLQSAPVEGYTLEADAQWFFDQKSMKNTPKFNIYLNSVDKSFNFGDASEGLHYSPAHYWFAKYCNEPFYQWYQDDLLDKHQERYADTIDEIQAIIWYNTDMDMSNVDDVSLDGVFNTEGSAVATMRSSFADKRALYAGIQGGDNMTGHMGYSLGNFVLDALGQRFINTIGAGNYSAQFATESYYAKRTEGQNTILFNPDASAGQEKSATATFTAFESDEDEAFAILDMSKTHKDVEDAKRGMYMTRGRKSVILQDEFKMTKPSEVYWFAQTKAAITLSEDKMSAVLRMGGEQMLVVLKQAPAGATLSVMQAKPLPTSPTAGDEAHKTYYKLAVHATDVTEGTISVEFIPIAPGETPSTARQTAFAPMSKWALNTNNPEVTAAEAFTNSVALKLESPVAFANGHKTYVDTNNYEVMPFTENGRTLVPVRFISEKIGGVVSWDEATQKVTVQHGRNEIVLHIGQNEMLVNGEVKVLDVPAQTVNGRTVIPLRAMVEAIGKNVFWDDRGLILINNDVQNPTEAEIVTMLALLDTRVLIGGNEFTAFTPDTTAYVAKPQGDNTVSVLSGGAAVDVQMNGATATFSLAGKTYTVALEEDKFAKLQGTDSDEVVSLIGMNIRKVKTSQTQVANYIVVEGAEMSTGHDKYISSGTIDNVINKEMINRWSGQGLGEYIIYDLGSVQNVHSFGLATYNGDTRSFLFALQISEDGANWTEILNTQTSGTTTLFDIFNLGDVQARYVKVIGYGDSNGGTYNSWTEVRFWANEAQQQADKAVWENGLDAVTVHKVGDVLKIDVTATNAKGGVMDSAGTTFVTDREGIITIAPDGTINVIGDGKVRITATLNNGFRDITTFTELVCE